MFEQTIEVRTPDGVMPAFLARPDASGPYPPVVLYMDIWGMREQLREIARSVAAEGFACAAPDLYYRESSRHFDHRHADDKTKSIFILPEEDRQRMLDYNRHLTDDMAISDTAALMTRLRAEDGISDGHAGCFGYCMGGRHVVKVAAALPEIFRATASFHGTNLATDQDGSPHLGAPKVEGEIYFGMGENDPFTPPDVIEKVRTAFDASPAKATYRVHPDTDHGYAIPDRDIYNASATEEDWIAVFGMFRRML